MIYQKLTDYKSMVSCPKCEHKKVFIESATSDDAYGIKHSRTSLFRCRCQQCGYTSEHTASGYNGLLNTTVPDSFAIEIAKKNWDNGIHEQTREEMYSFLVKRSQPAATGQDLNDNTSSVNLKISSTNYRL